MKKLALILAGCLALGSLNYSQGFKFPHETDRFKFIPPWGFVIDVAIRTEYGIIFNGVWYNKECKSEFDYLKRLKESEGRIPKNEFFIDFDNDDIPDSSLKELEELMEEYSQKEKLEKTFL